MAPYSQLVHPRRCWLNSRGCWDCLIVDAWRFMWSSQTLPRKTPRSWESKKGSSPARLTPLWGSIQLKHSFIKHLESWVLTDIYWIRYMTIRLVLMMYHVVSYASVPTAHLKVVTECCTLAGCKSGNWRVSSTAPFILLTGLRRQRWNGVKRWNHPEPPNTLHSLGGASSLSPTEAIDPPELQFQPTPGAVSTSWSRSLTKSITTTTCIIPYPLIL